MSVGRSGASLCFAAGPRLLLSAALCALAACGRLGYGLRDLDAGASGSSESSVTAVAPLRSNEPAGVLARAPRDAGSTDAARPPLLAATPPRVDAALPPPDDAPKLANGEACAADGECASSACVSGMCCDTHCDAPGSCHSGEGASCVDGRCVYEETAADGTSCDDGNACTTNDRCYLGYCLGAPRSCDDGLECTSDFCTAGACTHASSCDPMEGQCSYGLSEDHGYWLCPAALSFEGAATECSRIGAHLVTVNDAAEQEYLWQRGMRDTWIGYRGSARKGSGFEWLAGDSQYDAWAGGEPDAGVDSCAYLSAAEGGKWDSHACAQPAPGFACEIEQYAPPDAGCRYLRGFDLGYFICNGPRLWRDAQQRCESIGAKLAEVGNELEQGFLAVFLESGKRYAVGLSKRMQSGEFSWHTGTPLRFMAWDEGQPAEIMNGTSYVAMDGHSGLWSTMSGYERVGYVCEERR